MRITSKSKLDLSDVSVPELFVLNNMISLEGIDIKVYLYLLYCLNNNIEIDNENLVKKLCIKKEELSNSLDRLQNEELITKTTSGFVIVNLKEKEIEKLYTPKIIPKRRKADVEKEKIRTLAASSISESFFGGLMSFSWYNDIGIMFDKFKFEEEVMIALFSHCNKRNALNKKYVYKVAETWFKGNVKTFEDLEDYLEKVSKMQVIMKKISKALRLNRNLSKYEEAYIDKWINEYNYDFKIIEQALKRTTSINNPSISYVNGILKNWYKEGYKTLEDIEKEKKVTSNVKKVSSSKSKFKNYDQRKYNNLDSYYDM